MANWKGKRPLKNLTRAHSGFYAPFTSFAADIDLYTQGPGQGSTLPCAEIHVFPAAAGNLVIQRPDGTQVTLPVPGQPWVFPIEAAKIIAAGTTITGSCIVYW